MRKFLTPEQAIKNLRPNTDVYVDIHQKIIQKLINSEKTGLKTLKAIDTLIRDGYRVYSVSKIEKQKQMNQLNIVDLLV